MHGYLQRTLLTYRSSRLIGDRTESSAELMFGRDVRHPFKTFYTTDLIYTPKPSSQPENINLLFRTQREQFMLIVMAVSDWHI